MPPILMEWARLEKRFSPGALWERPMEKIEGVVEEIIFHNEGNGYTVLSLKREPSEPLRGHAAHPGRRRTACGWKGRDRAPGLRPPAADTEL